MKLFNYYLPLGAISCPYVWGFNMGSRATTDFRRRTTRWLSEQSEETNSVSEETNTAVESVALNWAKEQKEFFSGGNRKKLAVVGGGWGGWGAAKALCESGVDADVTLLDALPDPTGSSPFLSKTGKPGRQLTVEINQGFFFSEDFFYCECLEMQSRREQEDSGKITPTLTRSAQSCL